MPVLLLLLLLPLRIEHDNADKGYVKSPALQGYVAEACARGDWAQAFDSLPFVRVKRLLHSLLSAPL